MNRNQHRQAIEAKRIQEPVEDESLEELLRDLGVNTDGLLEDDDDNEAFRSEK